MGRIDRGSLRDSMFDQKNKSEYHHKLHKIYELTRNFSNEFLNFLKDFVKDTDNSYGDATLLEICIYFSMVSDLTIFGCKQKKSIREDTAHLLYQELQRQFDNVLDNKNLLEIINSRTTMYAKIVRLAENYPERMLYCLHLNIRRSRNTNKLGIWDFETACPVDDHTYGDSTQRLGLEIAETAIVSAYSCCLTNLMDGNDDFTQLTLDEIEKRINKGIIEAKGAVEKYNTVADFEVAIKKHEDQLFGIRLYHRAIELMYGSDKKTMEMSNYHYKNIIERGERVIAEAKELLKEVYAGKATDNTLGEFEFLPISGHPGLDDMTVRAQLLVEAYEKLFPDRPRNMPLTKEEYQRLLNEAVQYFE